VQSGRKVEVIVFGQPNDIAPSPATNARYFKRNGEGTYQAQAVAYYYLPIFGHDAFPVVWHRSITKEYYLTLVTTELLYTPNKGCERQLLAIIVRPALTVFPSVASIYKV
jgi:hypothetical protein